MPARSAGSTSLNAPCLPRCTPVSPNCMMQQSVDPRLPCGLPLCYTMRMRRPIWIVVALVLITTGSLGCHQSPPRELREAVERAEVIYDKFDAATKAFPAPSELSEKPCPTGLKALRIDWTKLCMISGTATMAPACGTSDDWVKQHGTWSFNDASMLRFRGYYVNTKNKLQKPSKRMWSKRLEEIQKTLEHFEAGQHLRVLRVTSHEVGRKVNSDRFLSGHIEAWIVTFDLESMDVVCAEKIRGENAKMVHEKDIEHQLYRGFNKQLHELDRKTAPHFFGPRGI